MKTKNNVKQTELKIAAVIVSIFLLSLTVNANSHWKNLLTSDPFMEIVNAMSDSPNESKKFTSDKNSAYAHISLLAEEDVEEALEFEEWMANEKLFSTIETPTNENYTLKSEFNEFLINVNESGLELEHWMMSEDHWEK